MGNFLNMIIIMLLDYIVKCIIEQRNSLIREENEQRYYETGGPIIEEL